MRLTGPQFKQLKKALLSAFPSQFALSEMVRIELDENLEAIAGTGILANVVYNLITWAVAHGRLQELVSKAHEAIPGNPDLHVFYEGFLEQANRLAVIEVSNPSWYKSTPVRWLSLSCLICVSFVVVLHFSFHHDTRINPKDGATMIPIPAGNFMMGDDMASDPSHIVRLDDYWIYKNPVTVAQFRKFCTSKPYAYDWDKYKPSWGWIDNHPMVNVTWNEAKAYCDWVGMRLPEEAEWEKAARGTDGRSYPWYGPWDSSKCANRLNRLGGTVGTSPVESYPKGESPYKVLDMAGNVYQWCATLYPHKAKYIVHGGAWYNNDPNVFRCSSRWDIDPHDQRNYLGFRCCISGQ